MISVKLNIFSNVLYMNSDLRVLFPDEILPDEKLKTLWLCHGGSGDENDWLYHSKIAEVPDRYHMAVVCVNAEDSCFVDMAHGRDFTKYIGEELPDILHTMFPHLSEKRADNFISGLSNGGYGCFIIGLTYPQRYAAIGAFSAGDKADAKYQKAQGDEMTPRIRMFGSEDIRGTRYSIRQLAKELSAKGKEKPRIYHACGSLDPWLNLNLLVKETFEELDDPDYGYTYDQMDGLGHEWQFWDIEIVKFIEWLAK
jgi:S-formylglutathione hydrolase FrmB